MGGGPAALTKMPASAATGYCDSFQLKFIDLPVVFVKKPGYAIGGWNLFGQCPGGIGAFILPY
jgi:hypothetical protein